MNEQALAQQIAAQVLKDTQFWIAFVGVIGGIAGACLTIIGSLLLHWLKGRPQRKLDLTRMEHLKVMLSGKHEWRYLTTMARVIGATDQETRRLLIALGARGGEQLLVGDHEAWALLSRKPLPTHDD